MISGWTIFSSEIKKETADVNFWKWYIRKNILKGITILVSITNNLHCVVCGELSQNYESKSSLAKHLQFEHFWKTVDFILENIMTKEPDELEKMINYDQ